MPTIVQPRVLPPDLEERWNAVQRSEILRTDIPDYTTYSVRTALGLSEAQAGLKEGPVCYSREAIQEFHATAFGSAVTDAGNFRTRMVQVGDVYGADGVRIGRELDLLENQHRHLHENARTPEDRLVAVAFAHARMVQIHPFTDGNGRTARAFMAAEASQEFGVDSEKVMEAIEADREGYIKAISQTSGQVVFHDEEIEDEGKHSFLTRFAQLFDTATDIPKEHHRVTREKVGILNGLVSYFAEKIEAAGGPAFHLKEIPDQNGEIYAPFHVRPCPATSYTLPAWEADWKNSQTCAAPDPNPLPSDSSSHFHRKRDNVDIDI